ncbi:MAG: MucR family transcriptional regulator [Alphaproteobacteria bacterium]|nr:MucR family transcriptional regulator [Alphaproteobacteria bacterium]
MCGKEFDYLAPHLRRAHGLSDDQYRSEFQISAGTPLCSDSYSQAHQEKIRRLQASGTLTYDHLPEAVDSARLAGRGTRTADDLREQADRARSIVREQLPPGEKRADGRDADRAREYQREYRKRKLEPDAPDRPNYKKASFGNFRKSIEGDPNPVDVYVGRRMRLRRIALGKTKSEIGNMICINQSMVTRYEDGTTRITMARLFDISTALGVDANYFFDGMPDSIKRQSPAHLDYKNPLNSFDTSEIRDMNVAEPPEIKSNGISRKNLADWNNPEKKAARIEAQQKAWNDPERKKERLKLLTNFINWRENKSKKHK